MAAKRYPVVDESIVRSLAEVLGRTEGGLTTSRSTSYWRRRVSRIRRRYSHPALT